MDHEIIYNEDKRNKMSSEDMSNNISVSLASLLKSFSQNSVGICDIPVSSELNIDFEHTLLKTKAENEDYCSKSDSFLTQLANGERLANIEYINDKISKSQFTNDLGRSLREQEGAITRFTNSRLSSNDNSINSIEMHNISTLKSLLNNQNGQIYLLVKGNNVEALDGSSNLSGIFDSSNYSNNIQLSNELGDDISSTETNHPSLMMAAQQLHLTNNLTTAELIQKILESPQVSCASNQLESMIGDTKISDAALPSLTSNYHRQSDNITNYYTCSIDSNNEADVTLLVDEDNPEQSSQFTITNNRTLKSEKQLFLLNGNVKLESHQTTDDIIDNSVKNHFNSLLNDRHDNLEINGELYNDLSNNFVQSNVITSFNTSNATLTSPNANVNGKRHKRIKTKPLKNIEINAFTEGTSKSYSPNSPIFSLSVSQVEDNSSKGSNNGNGEIKELKRKSSHNEVERRRRDRINTWIGELQNMLPNSEKMQLNRSKSHILKAVYDYFRGQTDQFNDIKSKNEKLEEENREKTAIIKKLETEKEVLLNQLQYINQAVTSTVKSTQESLNRSTVSQYRLNPAADKVKVSQPYRITNIYTNSDMTNFATGYIIDGSGGSGSASINTVSQSKKKKLTDEPGN